MQTCTSNISQIDFFGQIRAVKDLFSKTPHVSSTFVDVILPQLSAGTLSHLSVALKQSNTIAIAWAKILELAYVKNRLRLLDQEMLSRVSTVGLFGNALFYASLEKIMQQKEELIDCFLAFAASYKSAYYQTEPMLALIQQFMRFVEYAQKVQQLPHKNLFHCYSQGGMQWMQKCIATLQHSKCVQEQMQMWSALPSTRMISKAAKLQNTLHADGFKMGRAAMKKDPKLSLDHITIASTRSIPIGGCHSSGSEYLLLLSLLKQPQYKHLFMEMEQTQILHILLQLTTNSVAKGSPEAFILRCSQTKLQLDSDLFLLTLQPCSYGKQDTVQQAMQLQQQVLELAEDQAALLPILQDFYRRKINLMQCLQKLETAKAIFHQKKFPEKELQEVLQGFAASLTSLELKKLEEQYKKVLLREQELSTQNTSQMVTYVQQIRQHCKSMPLSENDHITLIAIARRAVQSYFGIRPYNTQILALLNMLHHPQKLKGRIAEVKTGEGKSTIVAMLTFYFACQNKTVDIISSSRYLAQRDQEKYAAFFQNFGITSSHICSDMQTKEQFQAEVLYGTNYDFEFAIIWDALYHRKHLTTVENGITKPRRFNVVIVDEVDNLMLDTALSSARVAISNPQQFQWVYRPILSFVQKHERLVKARVQKKQMDEITEQLRKYLEETQSGKFKTASEQFNNLRLQKWLSSAVDALYEKTCNKDYLIKALEKFTERGKVLQEQIVIIDRKNTGRLQENSRWQDGLHEFLEAKHNLSIEQHSIMPASMCHPIFFSYYKSIYGLTGTLGMEIERQEVQAVYQIDTTFVPPHLSNKRKLLEPIIVPPTKNFHEVLLIELKQMQAEQRPTLVLFETIQDTEEFCVFLQSKQMLYQLLNEKQSEHEDVVIARAGDPDMITIATNTAGRGTDIILHPTSLEKGGLHAIFTFYPENERVQAQGIGRAGRQGQPGSARMILPFSDDAVLEQVKEHGINFFALPGSKQIELLERAREEKTRRVSQHRKERAKMETISHRYLQRFFDQLQTYYEQIDEEFLQQFAKIWQQRVKKAECSKLVLIPTSKLQETFLQHAKIVESTSDDWMTFLQMAKAQLVEDVQQIWARLFYSKLDDLHATTQKAGLDSSAHSKEYEKQIDTLYQAQYAAWQQYIVYPRQGFENYLRLVTGI